MGTLTLHASCHIEKCRKGVSGCVFNTKCHRIGHSELVTFTYANDLGSGIVAPENETCSRLRCKMARLGQGKISISKISGVLVGTNRN